MHSVGGNSIDNPSVDRIPCEGIATSSHRIFGGTITLKVKWEADV